MTAARSIRTLLATLILALAFVAATAQPARAAQGLTTAQVNAILNLLDAFDAPQSTIEQISAILKGGTASIPPASSSGASAAIDQDSLRTGPGKFNITGQASGTKKVAVILVPTNYETYASITDYDTIVGQLGKDGIFVEKSNVKNGRWSAQFAINPASTFRVVVFDASTKAALTKGILIIADSANINEPSQTCTTGNSGRTECETEDSHEDDDDEDDSSEPVNTTPTVVVTYPERSKGPYDITRDGHYGTKMLVQWRNYNMPAGSKACTYLYNGSNGTSYPLPETNNCIGVGTSNQIASNSGYARVPAGTKYQARVVVYSPSGAVVAQDLSDAVFSMEVMDRNSQEKKAARDTTTTDSAGYLTVGGSAKVSKLYISVLKSSSSVYESQLFSVVEGRWSYTLTTALAKGTYTVAILDEAGNVLDSGSVYINPTSPKDSTGGVSVTEPSLTVTTTAGSLWVSIKGSTGKGCDGLTYTLDYGDGVNATVPMGTGSCQPIFTRSYPYKAPGTYTIHLRAPFECPQTASCAGVPVVSKTITVPGTTSMVPASELVASLVYLPESFYETMAKVTDMLAAVEMAPVYVITDALSDLLYRAGLY